jgi:hypothetical protein
LKHYAIGVTATPRTIEEIEVNADYFKSLDPK